MTPPAADASGDSGRIANLFERDVTRQIPPVVYFHQTEPEHLRGEVSEYIITGGYPADDPRRGRVERGIHEQYVRLLGNMAKELERIRKGGAWTGLPVSWISGFFGSGKSVFAKLLGCALDGLTLPDGSLLADAWLARDDSPQSDELVKAWQSLTGSIEPMACLFDVGANARAGEPIHSVAVRMLLGRLGYSDNPAIATEEFALEETGRYEEFLAVVERLNGRPWSEFVRKPRQERVVSSAMHALMPETYTDPLAWYSLHGMEAVPEVSADKAVSMIETMIERRAKGRTLFFVVDEVSQYVVGDNGRMLGLQSFVQALGQKLKGRVWMLVTGQEKLEEQASHELGKLQDRFPPHLRVHLDPANIREVVHRRLLAKSDKAEKTLRELFQRTRQNLKLFAYNCENLIEHDFVEFYPLLPAHVELLLETTTALRRSSRQQGDAHAIRGLLQLLGELFREQKLGERPVGDLITLENIFEVLQSSLESEAQETISRAMRWCADQDDQVARKAIKAVSLLELTQTEDNPTTAEQVARCLYPNINADGFQQDIEAALQRLKSANFLSHGEKLGYRLQSNAGADWAEERKNIGVSDDAMADFVFDRMRELVVGIRKPEHLGSGFEVNALFSDSRAIENRSLKSTRNSAAVTFDFRFLTNSADRKHEGWIRESDSKALKNHVVVINGEADTVLELARESLRSARMVQAKKARWSNLSAENQRLLLEEEVRSADLRDSFDTALRKCWRDGDAYFRGKHMPVENFAGSEFGPVFKAVGAQVLPTLFPHFNPKAVTRSDMDQLFEDSLAGVSRDLTGEGIGLVSLDAGKYVVDCSGAVPGQILGKVGTAGIGGETLFNELQRPPYGYGTGLIQICLLALLRAGRIRVALESGTILESFKDPDCRDTFTKERPLRHATIYPGADSQIPPRGIVKIVRSLFGEILGMDVDREYEPIADAVFAEFPKRKVALRNFLERFRSLPGESKLPPAIADLNALLDRCTSSRQVRPTVHAVFAGLDELREGLQQLAIAERELNDEAIVQLRKLADLRRFEIDQLDQIDALDDELRDVDKAIGAKLASDRPWRRLSEFDDGIETIVQRYRERRRRAITALGAELEKARRALKRRPGFEDLGTSDRAELLGILEAHIELPDPESVEPPLVDLLERLPGRLLRNLDQAHEKLDELLDSGGEDPDDETDVNGPKPHLRRVTTLTLDLEHKVLRNSEEVDVLLSGLRERLVQSLESADEVRLKIRRD